MTLILMMLIFIAFFAGWEVGHRDGAMFTDYWYGQSCFYFALLFGPDDDDGDEFEEEPPAPEPLKAMAAGAGRW